MLISLSRELGVSNGKCGQHVKTYGLFSFLKKVSPIDTVWKSLKSVGFLVNH